MKAVSTRLPSWNLDRLSALVFALTAVLVFSLNVTGGMVKALEAGSACPDWPTCLGSFAPPQGSGAALAYLHRALTALTGGGLLLSAGLAWIGRAHPAARGLLTGGLTLALILAVLGAGLSTGGQAGIPAGLLHLGLSLLALGMAAAASAIAAARSAGLEFSAARLSAEPISRLALFTLLVLSILLLSGGLAAALPGGRACAAWPLCSLNELASGPAAWLQQTHRLLVGLSGLLLVRLWLQTWRRSRANAPLLVGVTIALTAYLGMALLGAQMVAGYPVYQLLVHQGAAAAVWAALAAYTALSGVAWPAAGPAPAVEAVPPRRFAWLGDLLMLTKPVVVLLLLVTTYAGMVIGGRAWPSLATAFWTLLAGFMAAGGSGAINQYIDRDDDRKMQRTQKRPIPAGRLTPAEGLAFGAALCLGSFFVLTAFVNILAALLSLAGIIYYVILYSLLLKKTTVQNIVIGGGAGAIPPLVGWAAVTNSLNIPALLLFAVIFLWTPPHFWALALVRRKDYARAGVPMLPVMRGEKETRGQIMLYTLELVGLTLLLPLLGLGGSIYLVGAAALGAWLVWSAFRVWREGGNKLAWQMYRTSSMYLALIFVALMVDALL
jgi:protoheme IX farnesyltransferase